MHKNARGGARSSNIECYKDFYISERGSLLKEAQLLQWLTKILSRQQLFPLAPWFEWSRFTYNNYDDTTIRNINTNTICTKDKRNIIPHIPMVGFFFIHPESVSGWRARLVGGIILTTQPTVDLNNNNSQESQMDGSRDRAVSQRDRLTYSEVCCRHVATRSDTAYKVLSSIFVSPVLTTPLPM